MNVEPVGIVTGEVEGIGVALSVVLPWMMVCVGGGLMAGVSLHSLWRRYARLPDAERAFLLLSFRLRLGRRERAAVREMARAIGGAPVALLVSETALQRGIEAVGAVGAGKNRAGMWRAIKRVEARLAGS